MLFVVLVVGLTVVVYLRPDPVETFCLPGGLAGPNGELYGRSSRRNCQFVDDNGDLVRTLADGSPLCYTESGAADESGKAGANREPE